MGSGHGKALAVAMVWGCLATLSGVAHAQATARVVALNPHDPELVARVEGQTRDLPVAFHWVDESLDPSAGVAPWTALAQREQANFVIAVQPSAAGGHTVYVYDAALGRLRTRSAPRPRGAERLAVSAAAETAALIVRGELSAAIAGDSAGPEPDDAITAVATSPNVKRRPADTRKPATHGASAGEVNRPIAPHDDPAMRPQVLSLAAGARVGLPGAQRALLGPWLAVHLALSHIELGLVASTSLSAQLHDEVVSVSVRRHSLAAHVLVLAALTSSLELGLGAEAGVVLYTRESRVSNPALIKTADSTSWSPSLGPVAELRWRLAHSVGLAARIGVDFILRPTRFAYEPIGGGTPRQLAQLAFYEPWGALTLFVDIWE